MSNKIKDLAEKAYPKGYEQATKKSLTVLDFTKGEIHVYTYPAHIDNVEDWITANTDHDLDNIQYMCTDKLLLTMH